LPQEVNCTDDSCNFEEVIVVALKHDMCRQCFETLKIRGVTPVVFNEDFFVSIPLTSYLCLILERVLALRLFLYVKNVCSQF
jgi:hypothetical protein